MSSSFKWKDRSCYVITTFLFTFIPFCSLKKSFNTPFSLGSMLPQLITYNKWMWSFPDKIVNNVLLPKTNDTFGICKAISTVLFLQVIRTNTFSHNLQLWSVDCLRSELVQYFQNSIILTTLTPQTATFWILDSANNDSIFKNIKVFTKK